MLKKRHNLTAIGMCKLLLGWTALGWVLTPVLRLRTRHSLSHKMSKHSIPFIALALILPIVAQAQDTARKTPDRWQGVAISDGDTTLIDTKSIVRNRARDEVSVWIETRFNAPQTHRVLGTNYTRHRARATFDCEARTTRMVAWTTFTRSGSVAGEDLDPGYPFTTPVAIPPGTAGEMVFDSVCSPSTERPQTSGSTVNYPPTPTELFIPPLPVPAAVFGFHMIAEYDVDETGKVVGFTFAGTRDSGYNRRLEEVLRGFKFRPGTKPDGTPIRMKAQIVYDF